MSKFLYILSNFTKIELNAFIKYLQSRYFNQDVRLELLGIEIISNFKALDKNQIQLKEKYKDSLKKYDKKLSDLAVSFVTQQKFNKSTSLRTNLKLEHIRKKSIEKFHNSVLQEIKSLEVLEIDQTTDYYFHKYLIEKNIFELKTENEKKNEKVNISNQLNISEISNNLDIFFLLEKTKNYCFLFIENNNLYDQKKVNIDDLIQMILEMKVENYPALSIYKNLLLLFRNKSFDIKLYLETKILINNIQHIIPEAELLKIYECVFSLLNSKSNDVKFTQSEIKSLEKILNKLNY